VKLYSWLAGIAIAVAAISFVRYSVEHGLLSPPVRLAMGLAAGVGLLGGAETRAARRYALTAQALAGGGVVTLFATVWAAHALWGLVPAVGAFALLALVAVVAVLFAVRRDAFPVALLGLAGGFATPFLLSTGEDRPIGLFSYLLLLDVGLVWVARRRRWPLLTALAAGLTTLYQAGWVLEFVDDPAKLPVAVGVFLVFGAFGFVVLGLSLRGGAPVPALARSTAALGAIPPVLFAIHAASSPELAQRWPLLLGFVAVVAVGLAAVAAWQGPEWLHLVGTGASVAVLAALTVRGEPLATLGPAPRLWPGLGVFVLLLGAVPLAAPALLERLGRPLRAEGRWAVYGAPLLLILVLARLGLPDGGARLAPWSFTAGVLLLLLACAAAAVRAGDPGLHALAVVLAGVALATHAIPAGAADWQDPPGTARTLAALVGAAALGLAALGAPLLAERRGRRLRFHDESLPVEAFVLCAHLLVLVVAVDRTRPFEPAALLAVLAVLHLAVLADALRRRSLLLPVASAAAAVLAVAVAATRGELGAGTGGAALAVAVASVLAVAWRLLSEVGALGAAGVAAAAIAAAHAGQAAGGWTPGAALGAEALPWLLPVAYPLVRGVAARGERLSWGGAVLASAAFFPAARSALVALGAAPYIGALPLVQASILVPHVAALVRGGPVTTPVPRGILALVAGAALAFVTVAIPLQLEKQWITLGWALEAAALAGLWRRVPHRGLLVACAGLLAAVLVRLVLNPALLRYHARSHTPIWNWFLYAYLTAAGAAFVAAWLLARPRAAAGAVADGGEADRLLPAWPRLSALAAGEGALLLFALVNLEIADFFSSGPHLVFRIGASVAQDLTYTIAWAVFALGVLGAGVRLASRPARFAAIGLLSLTVLKAFLHDLSSLEGLYRVASFVGLAASLAVVAVVLQRFVLRREDGRAPGAAP
jgi:hypothetical protein